MFGKNEEEKELELKLEAEAEKKEAEEEKKEAEEESKKKADYILEKSKLTEKELLAEMIFLLEKLAKDSEQNTASIEDIYDIWANTGSVFKRDKLKKIR
jgi:hypothetical protein